MRDFILDSIHLDYKINIILASSDDECRNQLPVIQIIQRDRVECSNQPDSIGFNWIQSDSNRLQTRCRCHGNPDAHQLNQSSFGMGGGGCRISFALLKGSTGAGPDNSNLRAASAQLIGLLLTSF